MRNRACDIVRPIAATAGGCCCPLRWRFGSRIAVVGLAAAVIHSAHRPAGDRRPAPDRCAHPPSSATKLRGPRQPTRSPGSPTIAASTRSWRRSSNAPAASRRTARPGDARPRQLQGRQRHSRAPLRGRGAERGGREAAETRSAPPTPRPGSEARSSRSSCRAPTARPRTGSPSGRGKRSRTISVPRPGALLLGRGGHLPGRRRGRLEPLPARRRRALLGEASGQAAHAPLRSRATWRLAWTDQQAAEIAALLGGRRSDRARLPAGRRRWPAGTWSATRRWRASRAAPGRSPEAWFAQAHGCGLGPELEAAAIRAALRAARHARWAPTWPSTSARRPSPRSRSAKRSPPTSPGS